MQEPRLCSQWLHFMHKMEFLPTPFPRTEHGNSEVFIATVLSSAQKAFAFFTFAFRPFSSQLFSIVHISFLLILSHLQEVPNNQREEVPSHHLLINSL